MKLIVLQSSNLNWGYYYYSTTEDLRAIIARIENGTLIGSNVTIGNEVTIGVNCAIQDNIVIGSRAFIGSNFNVCTNVSHDEVFYTLSK